MRTMKKTVLFCLISIMLIFTVSAVTGCGCAARTEKPVGDESKDEASSDKNTDKDKDKDENEDADKDAAKDETQDPEQEETTDGTTEEDDVYEYGGFDKDSVEDEEAAGSSDGLDDMKQYPTDPVVDDKDWEV